MSTAVETIGQDVRQDFVERSREAEALLVEISREGRTDFLVSERAFLAREMGWSVDEQKKQLRRVNTILRLQAIAGDQKARDAALKECQVSTDLLAKQGPKIQQKIEQLQSELAGLERDASLSQRRVEQQAEAVSQLRSHCPADIKESVSLAVKVVEASVGQQLRDTQSRQNELRCILNIDNVYPDPKTHLEFGLKHLLPAAVRESVSNNMIARGYSPEWPMLRSQCESEYAAICERLPELQAEYDAAIEQAERPLGFYAG
jgi:hypothetical protein